MQQQVDWVSMKLQYKFGSVHGVHMYTLSLLQPGAYSPGIFLASYHIKINLEAIFNKMIAQEFSWE